MESESRDRGQDVISSEESLIFSPSMVIINLIKCLSIVYV